MKILVVDDNKLIRAILKDFLEAAGHVVRGVDSGEAALPLALSGEYPLVILDWMMPGLSGLDVCRQVRAREGGEDCLIMMLTAKDTEDDVKTAIASGANDYLFKPLDKALLQIRLQIAEGQISIMRMRRMAMAALEKSEFRYRSVAEHTADVIWMATADGTLSYISPAITELSGYELDQALGMNLADFFSAKSARLLNEQIDAVLVEFAAGQGSNAYTELLLKKEDGNEAWIETTLSPVEREDGAGTVVVGVMRDISVRKSAEIELADKEAFITKITSTTPNILYIFDLRRQQTTYVNRGSFSKSLGYGKSEIDSAGNDLFLKCLHPEDYLSWIENLGSCLSTTEDGDVLESEYRMQDSKGNWHWFQAREVVFSRDEEGRVITILGSAQDVTDRLQLQRIIDVAKNDLELIADAMEELIFLVDGSGVILRCNKSAIAAKDTDFQAMLGKNIETLFPAISSPDLVVNADPVVEVWRGEAVEYDVKIIATHLEIGVPRYIYVLRRRLSA